MATGRSPRAGLGAGRPPESLPAAHIRAQEGVGLTLSRSPGQEPAPPICQVPGRARAPGRLVPTSPGRLARPHPAAVGPRPARPCPTRPSLAGPRLPAGLGRTSPPARRAWRGRVSASRRPRCLGAWAGWHGCLLPRAGCPYFLPGGLGPLPPYIPRGWGVPTFTHVGAGPTPVSVCGSPHHPEYLRGGSFPSSELSPSSEGTPPEPLSQEWVKV